MVWTFWAIWRIDILVRTFENRSTEIVRRPTTTTKTTTFVQIELVYILSLFSSGFGYRTTYLQSYNPYNLHTLTNSH